MRFKKIIKLFNDQNVSVFGLRGRGKDLLFANVVIATYLISQISTTAVSLIRLFMRN